MWWPKGLIWTEVLVQPQWAVFSQLHWSNGRLLAIAFDEDRAPQMFTSTDGVHWTTHDPGLPQSLQVLAVNNGKWLGAWFGNTGGASTAVSSDGLTWTNVGTMSLAYPFGIVAGADVYVAYDGSGLAWSPRYTNASGLFAIAAGAGKAVAVGANGQTLVSSDGLTWVGTELGVPDHLNAIRFAEGRRNVSRQRLRGRSLLLPQRRRLDCP